MQIFLNEILLLFFFIIPSLGSSRSGSSNKGGVQCKGQASDQSSCQMSGQSGDQASGESSPVADDDGSPRVTTTTKEDIQDEAEGGANAYCNSRVMDMDIIV